MIPYSLCEFFVVFLGKRSIANMAGGRIAGSECNRCKHGNQGCSGAKGGAVQVRTSTRRYPLVWRKGVLNGYSSTRISLCDSLMLGRVLECPN